MPVFDVDSQSPGGSFEPQPTDTWSMPIGSIVGVRLFVSYSVFVALAVLAGLVAMVQNREGNGDLPLVALMAVAIWGFGWIVQLMVQLLLHLFTDAKTESVSIGLLGVETGNPLYRVRPWTAMSNLVSAFCSLTALVAFGGACLVVHMLTRPIDYSDWSMWAAELATPSFGLDAVRNCYLTATWLFWIQAACQAYPLPRNLGRGAIASAVALFAAEADRNLQLKLLQRLLQMVAIITLVVAMATMLADAEVFLPRWPILVLLAVMLWVSTRKHDLMDWITSVHFANLDAVSSYFSDSETEHADAFDDDAKQPPVESRATPWISEMIDGVRLRQKRKRAKAALERERNEAADAARLDQVLERVSEHGTEGLSAEDQALLKRVSNNLRRDRETEPNETD